MSPPQPILYCRCAYAKVVPADVKDGVLERLACSDVAFDSVADLCEMSAKQDPALERFAKQPGLRIAACYPRAVKWLFSAAGHPLPEGQAEVVNMRTLSADQAAACLIEGAPVPQIDAEGSSEKPPTGDGA
ncbi:hypothetical protein Pla123a_31830 [Posidoniimonas polymericola]|uniref:Uncharacterized protein n=1 Tax=Posidoniimonas polymericola TaxID=2528002 RepID=A0A5C5YL64_9BACT|nr:hypothetical protein [Posidoniimonas polymericola]TWT75673.1 hypothetical protein Pla123a_31830 [Posidoniimonas polymericola]